MLLLALTVALYGVATLLYLRTLTRNRDKDVGRASRVLEGTFIVHAVALGFWIGELGPEQMSRLIAVLPAAAWVVVAGYLILEARFGLHVLGTLVVPAVTITLLSCVASAANQPAMPGPVRGLLLTLHVLGATLGLAAFTLSSALSAFYILQERQLKAKRFGTMYQRLPSLDTMERLSFRITLLGFPVYTVAVILGGVRAHQEGGFGVMGVAYLPAVVSWAIYGLVLQGRLLAGWRGRKAALLMLAGYLASMLVLLQLLVR